MKQIIAVLVLSAMLLVGCTGLEPTATPTNTPQPTATSVPTPTPTSVPTPTPTTGQVKGALVEKSTGQAVAAKVNLIPVEVGDNGFITYRPELLKERLMSMDVASGVFLFENVEPGHYLITVKIGGGMPLDLTDDQGAQIVVQVEAGQVIDLDEIAVEK